MVVSDNEVKGSFQFGPKYNLFFSMETAVSRMSGLGAELMLKDTIGTVMVGADFVMVGQALGQSSKSKSKMK